ncbi:MAG: AMP-binding protein [Rhizomicrobium sp.]
MAAVTDGRELQAAEYVPDTADFVASHAATNGERTACVDLATREHVTYRELDLRVAKCIGYLQAKLGPSKGVRVAMLARNSVGLLVLHLACTRAGFIFQPLNWRLSGAELRAQISDAGPELFAYQAEFEDAALSASRDTSVRHTARIADGDDQLAAAIDAATPVHLVDGDPDAPVTLLYTSGTTGKPKGVIVTRRNAWTTAFNFSALNAVEAGDTLLCDMPMFHVAGLFGVARAALFSGATVLISDRFVPATALKRLSDPVLAVTHYFAVPAMAAAMLNDPTYLHADMTRLKALVIGGAPLPISIVERLLGDGVMVIEGYGLSEAGTVFGMPLDRDVIRRKCGSSGLPAKLLEVRLVDKNGHDAPTGEVGEIWLKGPSVTPGYWNQPEATANAFDSGWFKTGDAASRDRDGFYRIVDRWKDMYISGGENVYPAEVESVLAGHPSVAEAAVVGVADAQWGEIGCAFVVPRQGHALTARDVVEHCRSKLARYKLPKHVRFVEALPRTASGKVKKDALRRAHMEYENQESTR